MMRVIEKPFSHGGILRFDGQTMTHVPGTASYRCVFKNPPQKMRFQRVHKRVCLVRWLGCLVLFVIEAIRYITELGIINESNFNF